MTKTQIMNSEIKTINAIKISFSILAIFFGSFFVITTLFVPIHKLFTLNTLKELFESPVLLYCAVNFLFSVIVVTLLRESVNITKKIHYTTLLVAFLLVLDFVPIIRQVINIFRYGDMQFPKTLIILVFHAYFLHKLLKLKRRNGDIYDK